MITYLTLSYQRTIFIQNFCFCGNKKSFLMKIIILVFIIFILIVLISFQFLLIILIFRYKFYFFSIFQEDDSIYFWLILLTKHCDKKKGKIISWNGIKLLNRELKVLFLKLCFLIPDVDKKKIQFSISFHSFISPSWNLVSKFHSASIV